MMQRLFVCAALVAVIGLSSGCKGSSSTSKPAGSAPVAGFRDKAGEGNTNSKAPVDKFALPK